MPQSGTAADRMEEHGTHCVDRCAGWNVAGTDSAVLISASVARGESSVPNTHTGEIRTLTDGASSPFTHRGLLSLFLCEKILQSTRQIMHNSGIVWCTAWRDFGKMCGMQALTSQRDLSHSQTVSIHRQISGITVITKHQIEHQESSGIMCQ